MSATFDSTTKAAYDAATTAQARAEAIVASLTGTISVKVFNGSNTEMGSGTMAAPWATAVNNGVVIGEVTEFTVGTTATPDADWYIRFQNADVSRWARGSFGLLGSGQDYTWSLPAWTATNTGTIGTAYIIPTGNQAPTFTVAPTSASIAGTGGAIQFTAVDPEGGSVFYSLTTTRAGITINASGLVTVTAAAAGTSGNIVVRASDGILTASATCAVTVASGGGLIRFAPGHYIRPGLGDSLASVLSKLSTYDSRVKGITLFRYWKDIETSEGVYDWSWYDAVVATCQSYNKRILMRIQDRIFNQTNPALVVPQYIIDANLHYVTTTSPRAGTALWRAAAMDYSIEIYKLMIDRYRDVVSADGDPVLVGIYGEESIFGGVDLVYPDYSAEGLVTQELRRAHELRAYAPELPYFWLTNWITPHSTHSSTVWTGSLESHAAMERWFDEACRADPGIFTSYGPDTRFINGVQIDGWDCIRGLLGGVDHRDDYAVIGWTEALEWNAGSTAAQIYDGAINQAGAAIMVWSTNPAQWLSAAYPYIATRGTNEAVPTRLAGRLQVI